MEMFKCTFVGIDAQKKISSYNISSIPTIREDFRGNPRQRFLCNTAEGDGAVEGNGGGVLQRAQGEAFLQPAGGIHVSVSLSPHTATGVG